MVYIVDETMGRGKSSALINYVNDFANDGPFLFVVPYRKEVDRIMEACSGRDFITPDRENIRLRDLKTYMSEGRNVVCTHKLFTMFDPDIIRSAIEHKYTMIMDETPSVITAVQLSTHDAADIEENYITIDEDSVVHWIVPEYSGAFDGYKEMAEHSRVIRYSSTRWVNVADPVLFQAFKDVFVLTYMFDSSDLRCYFDMYGVQYRRKYVCGTSLEDYSLSDEPGEEYRYDYSELINIVDDAKLNEIGNDYNALSKGWYRRSKAEDFTRLRKNTYNFFHNKAGTHGESNLWTTFGQDAVTGVDYERLLRGAGYRTCFLSCNARGTNEYRDRTALAYLVNRFPDTSVSNYFSRRGIKVSRDMFGLSEMLQWVWRSAIRDGKPIQLYVPSSRMRGLLRQWIEDTSKGVRY